MALHHVGAGLVLNMLLLIDVGTNVKLDVQHVSIPEQLLVWLCIQCLVGISFTISCLLYSLIKQPARVVLKTRKDYTGFFTEASVIKQFWLVPGSGTHAAIILHHIRTYTLGIPYVHCIILYCPKYVIQVEFATYHRIICYMIS